MTDESSIDQHQLSLELKLSLLAQGMEMGLTAAEAAIYGVEDADLMEDEDLDEDQSSAWNEKTRGSNVFMDPLS